MPRRYARGEERRGAILGAAYDVLDRNGFRRTSLREIARELELQPAHVLYYFDSREALLEEVIREWDARNAPEIPELGGFGDFEWLLMSARGNVEHPGMVQAYLGFAVEASEASHPSHGFLAARYGALREAVLDVLKNMRSAGDIANDLDLDRAATSIMALSDGLDLQWLINPEVDLSTELAHGIRRITGAV